MGELQSESEGSSIIGSEGAKQTPKKLQSNEVYRWPSNQEVLLGGNSEKRKYHLVKCDVVCKPGQKGGLGIKNLQMFNHCLFCKWWWKLETKDGLWQRLVKTKYGIK
jgi:hypothetical protein